MENQIERNVKKYFYYYYCQKNAKLAMAVINKAKLVEKQRYMPYKIENVNYCQCCIEKIGLKKCLYIYGIKRSYD